MRSTDKKPWSNVDHQLRDALAALASGESAAQSRVVQLARPVVTPMVSRSLPLDERDAVTNEILRRVLKGAESFRADGRPSARSPPSRS